MGGGPKGSLRGRSKLLSTFQLHLTVPSARCTLHVSSWMASKQRAARTIKIAWYLHGTQGFVLTASEGVRHMRGIGCQGVQVGGN